MKFLPWRKQLQRAQTRASSNVTAPKTASTIKALWRLQKIILDTLDFNEVVQRIVDGLLVELGYLDLGYKIIVLCLVDSEKNVLKRISISRTHEAEKAQEASAVPFHDIEIPLDAKDNLLIKTIVDKIPRHTHDWHDLFIPVLSAEESVANQQAAGIKTSMVYPVEVREKTIGVLIFSLNKSEDDVKEDEKELISGFTDVVGIAVQNSQLYSSLELTSVDLKEANERLKMLDRMKDNFVSVASHELRTPMTAIKQYLWWVLQGKSGELTDKQKFDIQRAYNSADRLIRLVNDMLNISRIDSGRITIHIEKVDLITLVQQVLDEVTPHAQELGINLVLDKNYSTPPVLADADKIKEVIFNLVGNSLKFTPAGGTVTVSFVQKESVVEITVRDTGVGIEQENMPKLFQRFGLLEGSYTTNQSSTVMGTGLGLYICKEIVELQDGKIWATSEGKGKGAQFMFTLKVYSDDGLKSMSDKFGQGQIDNVGLLHTQM